MWYILTPAVTINTTPIGGFKAMKSIMNYNEPINLNRIFKFLIP